MKKMVESKFDNDVIMQQEIWGNFNKQLYKSMMNLNKISDFKLIRYIEKISKNNVLFFYPALYGAHKNHNNLLEAFFLLSKLSLNHIGFIVISKNEIISRKF